MAKTEVPKPKFISRLNAARHIGASVQFIDKQVGLGNLTRYHLGDRKVVFLVTDLERLVRS